MSHTKILRDLYRKIDIKNMFDVFNITADLNFTAVSNQSTDFKNSVNTVFNNMDLITVVIRRQ
ncbi:hypothetical protein Pcaca04_04380 [Pectobacterium carotovorum subsp. carotovorum]|nr:hypothetical protein Pcaca04_04380 [Pectobacterium carotovorum subsp. carotovorum]